MDQDADERAALCYVREYGKTGAHCEAGFVNRQTKDVSSYSWGFFYLLKKFSLDQIFRSGLRVSMAP